MGKFMPSRTDVCEFLTDAHRLNSTGLEDALSVSPEGQRLAFQNRYRYDLVVICDTRSTRLPAKGEAPTPAGRLFSIIGENEFVKPLPRFPALLVGGYEGWVEFIKQRQSLGEKEYMRMLQARARANSGATNGHDA
jgi:ubiquitin carboxyl-terminal hydrolase 8